MSQWKIQICFGSGTGSRTRCMDSARFAGEKFTTPTLDFAGAANTERSNYHDCKA